MKRTVIAGIALVLAAQTSIAQSNTVATHKPVGRHVKQDISKWDANKNGRLDGEEQAAFRRDRIREHEAELDTRAKAAAEARKLDEAARRTRLTPPAQLQQYDVNKNGLMDADEWKAYRKEVDRLTAEKRAARQAALPAATNGVSTNSP